ncbi:hypothetical protein HPC49_19045 [Pyxidicoccus fallax]|uniref:Uncharacterized protein n=1 Tax=Pyxidicoccus fallax TaxID=394095 RepID=A0A848LAQ9_9BACT|nr:hypothetical protein [Pyxidicoccus fallax]NMO13401.1 hypothetical protein [Pyxidicoccus fallax]NPC80310.1 hypothetical protein [Pyxidicoccus fallax]
MKLKLALAAVVMCIGFTVGYGTRAEAESSCESCWESYEICLSTVVTSTQEAACIRQLRQCRTAWCE